MDERLHLLGIRHHGPGSAALVLAALDRIDPAAVLIEGAPEGAALVPYLDGLKPPVAMLFYAVDDPKASVFRPARRVLSGMAGAPVGRGPATARHLHRLARLHLAGLDVRSRRLRRTRRPARFARAYRRAR